MCVCLSQTSLCGTTLSMLVLFLYYCVCLLFNEDGLLSDKLRHLFYFPTSMGSRLLVNYMSFWCR